MPKTQASEEAATSAQTSKEEWQLWGEGTHEETWRQMGMVEEMDGRDCWGDVAEDVLVAGGTP